MAFKLLIDGEPRDIEIVARRPHLTVRIDGRTHEVAWTGNGDGELSLTIDGEPVGAVRAGAGEQQVVRFGGRTYQASQVDQRAAAEAAGGAQDAIRAPMPGAVVSLHKAAGEAVKRGETVVTIESMKLQTALAAVRDGVVAALLKTEGATFEKDEVLARLEPLGGAA